MKKQITLVVFVMMLAVPLAFAQCTGSQQAEFYQKLEQTKNSMGTATSRVDEARQAITQLNSLGLEAGTARAALIVAKQRLQQASSNYNNALNQFKADNCDDAVAELDAAIATLAQSITASGAATGNSSLELSQNQAQIKYSITAISSSEIVKLDSLLAQARQIEDSEARSRAIVEIFGMQEQLRRISDTGEAESLAIAADALKAVQLRSNQVEIEIERKPKTPADTASRALPGDALLSPRELPALPEPTASENYVFFLAPVLIVIVLVMLGTIVRMIKPREKKPKTLYEALIKKK